ncbi:MAG: exodeoxyribonuclease VII small subunit [Alphaproteobacteria bacterium]|tara:strand:+ start:384 stop:605 length:222 start_codon:yes stop_codon:yes gene_type:complete
MDLFDKKIDKLSFEEAFERLKKIVELMEDGKISLDDSIKYYEIGSLLKNHCEKKLKNAEIQIKKVIDKKAIDE